VYAPATTGRRRLPIHDAAHVRAALARFSQVRFDSDDSRAHTEKYVCFVALVSPDIKKQVTWPKCL